MVLFIYNYEINIKVPHYRILNDQLQNEESFKLGRKSILKSLELLYFVGNYQL